MVGLMIYEKITPQNLSILEIGKEVLGRDVFRSYLTAYRTLTIPTQFDDLEKYMSRHLLQDKHKTPFDLYYLAVPGHLTGNLKKTYHATVTLLEHYARNCCEQVGNTYGLFIITTENFEPGYLKFSARGSLVKPLFTKNPDLSRLFASWGISGDSAMGGKVANRKATNFKEKLLKKIQARARQIEIKLPQRSPEIQSRIKQLCD